MWPVTSRRQEDDGAGQAGWAVGGPGLLVQGTPSKTFPEAPRGRGVSLRRLPPRPRAGLARGRLEGHVRTAQKSGPVTDACPCSHATAAGSQGIPYNTKGAPTPLCKVPTGLDLHTGTRSPPPGALPDYPAPQRPRAVREVIRRFQAGGHH